MAADDGDVDVGDVEALGLLHFFFFLPERGRERKRDILKKKDREKRRRMVKERKKTESKRTTKKDQKIKQKSKES